MGGIQTVQGIVVGDYETGGRKGYFVQEEDTDADGNAATSEGIFVYDANTTSEVSLGDKVRVTGTVSEFSGLTEAGHDHIPARLQQRPGRLGLDDLGEPAGGRCIAPGALRGDEGDRSLRR